MKKLKTLITALTLSFGASAQAPLPTSYDFNNFVSTSNLPSGWTTNLAGASGISYPSGGNQGSTAARLDADFEYIQIQTADAIGLSTFWAAGTSTNTAWTGTFVVQESVTGASWTTIAGSNYANNLTLSLVQYSFTPLNSSRYVRFYYLDKASGFNLVLDDVNLTAAPVTAQEINMKQAGTTILSGGNSALFNSAVGTPTTVNFTIENLGSVSPLTVSSIGLTGPGASDFTVTAPTTPATVGAVSNIPLTLSFNPSVAGTRSAILSITNDDANESVYVINLNGIGGNFATQPSSQPSNLTFSNIKSYRASASFISAAGSPEGYVILKKQSASAITDIPVDGVAYKVGDAIGTSKVIFSGNSTNIGLSNVYAGLGYQLAIFSYNGSGSFTSYLVANPLTGGFTALPTMQPVSEYSSLNVTNTNFLTSLSAKIYPHTAIFYGNYDETMVKLFTARDTTNGDKVITCVYSGEQYVYSEPLVWGYMSREHSYCHNWMPSNPADSPERPEYSDQHHLFPTNQNDVNAIRSNYPMGEVALLNVNAPYLLAKWGKDKDSNFVFEPRAVHKGDFARAVMYMATAYNGQLKGSTVMNWKFRNPITPVSIAYGQDQNILKKWHFQDLPDSYEISRNDFLDSLQGNRNPFIDSVRYACYIDFSNMTYIPYTGGAAPCYTQVGIKENVATQFEYVLAPNPTSGEFYLLIDAKVAEKFNLDIMDVTGRNVYKRTIDVVNGFNNVIVNDLKLQSGIYFVNLNYKNEKITRKLIIQ